MPFASFGQLDALPRLKWCLRIKGLDAGLVAAFVMQQIGSGCHGFGSIAVKRPSSLKAVLILKGYFRQKGDDFIIGANLVDQWCADHEFSKPNHAANPCRNQSHVLAAPPICMLFWQCGWFIEFATNNHFYYLKTENSS
jgi:hypothetical protein